MVKLYNCNELNKFQNIKKSICTFSINPKGIFIIIYLWSQKFAVAVCMRA